MCVGVCEQRRIPDATEHHARSAKGEAALSGVAVALFPVVLHIFFKYHVQVVWGAFFLFCLHDVGTALKHLNNSLVQHFPQSSLELMRREGNLVELLAQVLRHDAGRVQPHSPAHSLDALVLVAKLVVVRRRRRRLVAVHGRLLAVDAVLSRLRPSVDRSGRGVRGGAVRRDRCLARLARLSRLGGILPQQVVEGTVPGVQKVADAVVGVQQQLSVDVAGEHAHVKAEGAVLLVECAELDVETHRLPAVGRRAAALVSGGERLQEIEGVQGDVDGAGAVAHGQSDAPVVGHLPAVETAHENHLLDRLVGDLELLAGARLGAQHLVARDVEERLCLLAAIRRGCLRRAGDAVVSALLLLATQEACATAALELVLPESHLFFARKKRLGV
eukprot:Rhum_TRINITY_DN14599_c24_g1::Rhum_TRINITY_DN14599_c24_g1_i1::g.102190::m.102190